MAQKRAWEEEYRKLKLVSIENKPHAEIVRLVRTLKKKYGFLLWGKNILDIGSGTGRNAFYFAEEGGIVTGIDISPTAIQVASKRAEEAGLPITYIEESISDPFSLENESIHFAIDILASNSLSEAERKLYVQELLRVLAPGAFFFLRTLAKEGDANASELLKRSPGLEENTYTIRELNLTETVFTKESLLTTYGQALKLLSLEKKAHYPEMNGRVYKRQFYYALFQKTV